ncbi:MAG: PLP-dependent aspartate aminotransferase family protein [Pseudomonadota bacterium]
MKFETALVQAGERSVAGSGDVVAPLHLATTHERSPQDPVRFYYARGENPTRERLEACLSALEGARYASVFSSGQAAAATLLSCFRASRRAVVGADVYSGTYGLLARSGLDVTYTDLADPSTALDVLGNGSDPIDLVWVETPGNPRLSVVDLETVCHLAHDRGALVVVDNTVASPALQQPLRWADVSLYSATKSLSGHMDVLGGALVYQDDALHAELREQRTLLGNVPGPFDCYSIRRGIKTLALRVERQCATAMRLAAALEEAPGVTEVLFPGLASHAGHEVASRQMAGYGSLIGFRYAGDVATALARVKCFAVAVSLGGVQSLIEHPASMSHRSLPDDVIGQAKVSDDLVRVSVGIEHADDLIDDLLSALREGSEMS